MKEEIDQSKRRVIKVAVTMAGAATFVTLPASGVAADQCGDNCIGQPAVRQVWPPVATQSALNVETKPAAYGRGLEIIITNVSDRPVSINQVTPAQCSTSKGCFELAELVKNGPRHLSAGESISIRCNNSTEIGSGVIKGSERFGISVVTGSNSLVTTSYTIAV